MNNQIDLRPRLYEMRKAKTPGIVPPLEGDRFDALLVVFHTCVRISCSLFLL